MGDEPELKSNGVRP